jgi:hypothetical protein
VVRRLLAKERMGMRLAWQTGRVTLLWESLRRLRCQKQVQVQRRKQWRGEMRREQRARQEQQVLLPMQRARKVLEPRSLPRSSTS